MEELTENLACSFQVATEPNNPAAPHPRFSQYKIKSSVPNQVERRKRILQVQKKRRFDYVNHMRKLAEGNWRDEGEEEETQEDEGMDCEVTVKKPGRFYKDQLMLSEWMVEVPEDFESAWLMRLCPVGKRCLVVTSRSVTSVYAKNGYRIARHPSSLPGGNRKNSMGNTILDCIYSEVDKTYYILDIMCWKGHPVVDSDTEFRFYWLRTRCEENPEVTQVASYNPYRFLPLPYHQCDRETIAEVTAQPLTYQLDGLLFFHRQAHYLFGSTPLVGWLKPFMLSEMLGINVPQEYIPSSYTNSAEYIENYEKKAKLKKERWELSKKKRSEGDNGGDAMEVVQEGKGQHKTKPNRSRRRGKKGGGGGDGMEVEVGSKDDAETKPSESDGTAHGAEMEVTEVKSASLRVREHLDLT